MTEYKVIVKKISNLVWRDVGKAAQGLTEEVSSHISSGWEPQGGIASVMTGSSVYLIQAVVRRARH